MTDNMTQTNNEREEYENFEAWLCTLNSFSPSELRFGFLAWQAAKQSPISQNEQQEPIALLALKNTELNRRIEVLEDLLASAAVISLRRGEDTHWDRFIAQLKIKGICFVTPKTFKILPSDEEYASPPKQAIPEGWKPIETAPMDGTYVDLWDKSGFRWTKMYYGFHQWLNGKPISGKSWGGESGDGPGACPTHWMPLPSAPTNTEVGNDR